jgi:organic radical activating enzyme
LPKKEWETLIDYRNRVIDSVSPSFCAAKWLNATIWLGSGTTASCHHPPAHKIPLKEVQENFKAIHNTKHKKLMRKMMLNGERPQECEYCWKIEDIGKDTVSDRVFKTIIYEDSDVQQLSKFPYDTDVDLKTLEISFDRVCNLACSYCNSSFSTSWARDIKQNGPYQNLVSDGAGAFQHDGAWAEPYKNDEENPYVQAFWEWWNNGLSDSLEELRITGGEPLMSSNTWKLFDWFETQNSNMRFAVNTNLIAKPEIIDRLVEKSKSIKNFHLYTSCEAVGNQAEFIRDGLDYSQWKENLTRVVNECNLKGLTIMMTINSLCLFSVTDFLDEMYEFKEHVQKTKGKGKAFTVSLNLLRFPSFQSPLALPDHVKQYCRQNLSSWYETSKDRPLWHEFEKASIERLIDYLDTVDAPHRRTSNKLTLWRDFKTFYTDYCLRRNKSLAVFPKILTDWFDCLPTTITDKVKLINGDSTLQYLEDEELLKLAKEEGWILNPDSKNIEDPLGKY